MEQFTKDMKALGFCFDGDFTITNRSVAAYKDCSDDERDDSFYDEYADKFYNWAKPILAKVKELSKKHNVKMTFETSAPNGMIIVYV
jgi:hypothetical protein